MPKRRPACQLAAAITAGPPPQAKDFPDDEEWHHEQENWIAKQPTGVAEVLPKRGDAARRKAWQRITKQHAATMKEARVTAAATDGATASSPAAPPTRHASSAEALTAQPPAQQLPAPQSPAPRSRAAPRPKAPPTPQPQPSCESSWDVFQRGGPEAERLRRSFRSSMKFCHDEPGAGGTQWEGCNAWHHVAVPCSEAHLFPAHRGMLKILDRMAGTLYIDGHGEQEGGMNVSDFLANPCLPKVFSWPVD